MCRSGAVRQVLKTIRGIVLLSNATHTAVPDIQTNLFQLLCHVRPAMAAQAEPGVFLDVRQRHRIGTLSAAGRATAQSRQPTWADIHDAAHPANGERRPVFFNESEPHGVGHSLEPMAFMPSMAREEHRGLFWNLPLLLENPVLAPKPVIPLGPVPNPPWKPQPYLGAS